MRRLWIVLSLWLAAATPAVSQVNVGIGISTPGVSIGINLPAYPRLVRVPDYPVYYAAQVQGNFFFYDGLYWVLEGDNWYASSWYNGPWGLVAPQVVPVYLLRVPVRYYRYPPGYFRGWERTCAAARAAAQLPAQVPQRALPAGRAAALAARPELPLPAARAGRPPDLPGARPSGFADTPPQPQKSERGQGHGRDKDDGPGRGNSK